MDSIIVDTSMTDPTTEICREAMSELSNFKAKIQSENYSKFSAFKAEIQHVQTVYLPVFNLKL